MLKGLYLAALKEKNDIASMSVPGWRFEIIKNGDYVLLITHSPTSVYMHAWQTKPIDYKEYLRMDEFMKSYPSRGKKLYPSFSNFTFA